MIELERGIVKVRTGLVGAFPPREYRGRRGRERDDLIIGNEAANVIGAATERRNARERWGRYGKGGDGPEIDSFGGDGDDRLRGDAGDDPSTREDGSDTPEGES